MLCQVMPEVRPELAGLFEQLDEGAHVEFAGIADDLLRKGLEALAIQLSLTAFRERDAETGNASVRFGVPQARLGRESLKENLLLEPPNSLDASKRMLPSSRGQGHGDLHSAASDSTTSSSSSSSSSSSTSSSTSGAPPPSVSIGPARPPRHSDPRENAADATALIEGDGGDEDNEDDEVVGPLPPSDPRARVAVAPLDGEDGEGDAAVAGDGDGRQAWMKGNFSSLLTAKGDGAKGAASASGGGTVKSAPRSGLGYNNSTRLTIATKGADETNANANGNSTASSSSLSSRPLSMLEMQQQRAAAEAAATSSSSTTGKKDAWRPFDREKDLVVRRTLDVRGYLEKSGNISDRFSK